MRLADILLLAVGLSMDAFAVAVCKGLALKKISLRSAGIVGLWFGGFQALMPLIGFGVAALFADSIKAVDHWVAFVLLALIGANMLREAFGDGEEETEECGSALSVKAMLPMAIATSIDAMAVGVTFAFTGTYGNIWLSVLFIGVTTCLLSMAGVKVGSVFGAKYEKKAEILGGVILILLGLKILLEHLGVM